MAGNRGFGEVVLRIALVVCAVAFAVLLLSAGAAEAWIPVPFLLLGLLFQAGLPPRRTPVRVPIAPLRRPPSRAPPAR